MFKGLVPLQDVLLRGSSTSIAPSAQHIAWQYSRGNEFRNSESGIYGAYCSVWPRWDEKAVQYTLSFTAWSKGHGRVFDVQRRNGMV
jgi:hypothetical protein